MTLIPILLVSAVFSAAVIGCTLIAWRWRVYKLLDYISVELMEMHIAMDRHCYDSAYDRFIQLKAYVREERNKML